MISVFKIPQMAISHNIKLKEPARMRAPAPVSSILSPFVRRVGGLELARHGLELGLYADDLLGLAARDAIAEVLHRHLAELVGRNVDGLEERDLVDRLAAVGRHRALRGDNGLRGLAASESDSSLLRLGGRRGSFLGSGLKLDLLGLERVDALLDLLRGLLRLGAAGLELARLNIHLSCLRPVGLADLVGRGVERLGLDVVPGARVHPELELLHEAGDLGDCLLERLGHLDVLDRRLGVDDRDTADGTRRLAGLGRGERDHRCRGLEARVLALPGLDGLELGLRGRELGLDLLHLLHGSHCCRRVPARESGLRRRLVGGPLALELRDLLADLGLLVLGRLRGVLLAARLSRGLLALDPVREPADGSLDLAEL